jgi:hypothetical protein
MPNTGFLVTLQNALIATGLSRSIILGGPDPDRQAIGIVFGELEKIPADGYAVADLEAGRDGVLGRGKLICLPRITGLGLQERLGTVTRGVVAVFRDAATLGVSSLAMAVPEESVFGRLGNEIAVRAILGAADTFWRNYHETGLRHILIAVPSGRFSLRL